MLLSMNIKEHNKAPIEDPYAEGATLKDLGIFTEIRPQLPDSHTYLVKQSTKCSRMRSIN